MQRVVHCRRDPFDVYVGRPGKWGNPFRVGVDGKRGECVWKYMEWILRGEGRHLLRDLGELEGKTLGCWCAPKGGLKAGDPVECHGQILLRLLIHRAAKLEEKRARLSR